MCYFSLQNNRKRMEVPKIFSINSDSGSVSTSKHSTATRRKAAASWSSHIGNINRSFSRSLLK